MTEQASATAPRYMEAINQALDRALADDKRVILLGVDVGASGGVYGVTRGLFEEVRNASACSTRRSPRPASSAQRSAPRWPGCAR